MPIQILPEVVASQIAAGEVVERPASVVKELVENALDAGARSIRVEVEGGGRRLIRVTDDGSGIPAEEAALAFARHATSKIRQIEDLDSIQTLGFRGEALASIAAVAQVTLTTRVREAAAGVQIRMEGGQLTDQRAVGVPHGTQITVENLFYNTPARLKFMKADATERRHIDTVITRYAMAYPGVRFSLAQEGRVTFSTTGSGALADVLIEALGLDIMREMLPIAPGPSGAISVTGYTSTPSLNRNTRGYITLFVNGRHVQDSSLNYAITQGYHTLIPADRYPVAVVMIALPPADVDVNVHPTKAEVRFRTPDAVFSAVGRAIRRTVLGGAGTPTVQPSVFDSPPAHWRDPEPETASANPFLPPPRGDQLGLPAQPEDAGRFGGHIPETGPRLPESPTADPEPIRPRSLPPMRIVGQLAAMYIVAEGPAGLYLVDQHAAHERILYEQMMRAHAAKRPIAQRTLGAVSVELPPQALRVLDEYAEVLAELGFELEPFGGRTVRVRAVPAMLANVDPDEALTDVLGDLESGAAPGAGEIEAQIVRRVCKAGAVKAGQVLSYTEMADLMRQLERCETPLTCPHGRPTMIHISAGQLAKEFGRT
jgi:DNA mismatch repair protein MutL